MAITLTSQMTDKLINPGSPTSLGTGNAQASETVINLMGSGCSAIGHSGTPGSASPTIANMRGAEIAITSTTRTDQHLHIWMRDLYPIRSKALNGLSVYVNGGAAALYGFEGIDTGYLGSWYHAVLNLDPTDRPAADIGTAPTGNITNVGYEGNLSADKGEDFLQNCYFDAIRTATGGQGVSMYGGTSGAREDFLGMADADTLFYGCFRNVGGAFRCEGPWTLGVATQTTYIQENLKTINFTHYTTTGGDEAVAPDYYRVVLADGTTGVTNVDFTDVTLQGASALSPFSFKSNLGTGDAYTSLRTTYVFGATITLNSLCTSDSDTFIECVGIVCNGITLTDPTMNNCTSMVLLSASSGVTGGSTTLHNTATSAAYIITNDLDKITGHTFDNTGGTGHAISLGTVSATRSDNCDNIFTGYSTTVNGNKAILVNVASGQTYTINVTGDGNLAANLVYNSGVGTLIVNAGVVSTSVNVKDQAGANIINARVVVETAIAGGEPYQDSISIISFSGVATVTHTGHGMATNDWMVIRGASPASYSKVAQITVTGANTYTYAVTTGISTPATGTPIASFVPLYGLTDASGNITASRTWSASQAISGYARKSTVTPFYKTSNFAGTVSNTLGFSANITLLDDE